MSEWLEKIERKVQRRVPELCNDKNKDLLDDLIEDAFQQIVIHANADAYNKAWDNILVNCVVTLYNYLGNEGSLHRSADGVSDTYDSSNILSQILSRNIPSYVKPAGYTFSATRFNMPE